jgi:integrase
MDSGENPDVTKWIKTKPVRDSPVQKEDLITKNEVVEMIQAADHPRDKALIALLYDSGGRIGEIANAKIKDIYFDENGARIFLDGKTGKRTIRIIMSTTYLAAWLDIHPQINDLNAPLWVSVGTNNRGKPVKYRALANALRRTAKKAGIQKRIYPHLFRHSRATEIANYFTEAQLDSHLGWTPGSNMPRMYVHLSGQDADRAMLAMHGIKQEDKHPILTFKECNICGTKNGPTSVRCSQCGRALDVPEHMNLEERRKQLMMKLTEFISNDNGVNTVFQESLGAV